MPDRTLAGLAAGSLAVLVVTSWLPAWSTPLRAGWVAFALAVLARSLCRTLKANGHLIKARLRLSPPRAPPDYIRALFDDYAERFDEHLLVELAYAVPNRLRDLVDAHLARGRRLHVADLGCGTGVLAPLFRGMAAFLEGVDLAPAMLDRARARGLYDRLHEADIVAFLEARPQAFDLLLAGDVLVYVGDLRPFMRAARDALRPGGHAAFSLETHAGERWRLRRTGRYAHAEAYVRAAAAAAGLEVVEIRHAVLRLEHHEPLAGLLALLRRPAGEAGADRSSGA